MRSVTSTRGRFELRERDDLEAGDAAATPLPDRPRADQRQRLGDVVAAGAHVRRAPDGRARSPSATRPRPGNSARPAARPSAARAPRRPASARRGRRRSRSCARSAGSRPARASARPTGRAATNLPARAARSAAISRRARRRERCAGCRTARSIQPSTAPCGAGRRRRSQAQRVSDDESRHEPSAAPAARPCRRRAAPRAVSARLAASAAGPRLPPSGLARRSRSPADRSPARDRRRARACSDASVVPPPRAARARAPPASSRAAVRRRSPRTCSPSRICISFRSQICASSFASASSPVALQRRGRVPVEAMRRARGRRSRRDELSRARWIAAARPRIFVDQRFDLAPRPVALGARHRRHQMIDDTAAARRFACAPRPDR